MVFDLYDHSCTVSNSLNYSLGLYIENSLKRWFKSKITERRYFLNSQDRAKQQIYSSYFQNADQNIFVDRVLSFSTFSSLLPRPL